METLDQSSQSFRAKYGSSLSTAMVAMVGLTFFGYNAHFAASRAGNTPLINIFFIATFLTMGLLDFLLILHSAKPEAFEERKSLKMATLGSIVALTLAFLGYLWISVPPALRWVVWVACAITVLSAVGMRSLCRSLTESVEVQTCKALD
ncbi:hypothetical protein AMTR_s00078p00070190 [Amborella trichopoda]|uniref:Uncharacterized protein n=1 Tax=Amborella trichopoda TaxID=13333 RepID=W1P848_AMBTC|nr:hypothetical protein AMTR_s00078p00070190 [Amborella trichopoda]